MRQLLYLLITYISIFTRKIHISHVLDNKSLSYWDFAYHLLPLHKTSEANNCCLCKWHPIHWKCLLCWFCLSSAEVYLAQQPGHVCWFSRYCHCGFFVDNSDAFCCLSISVHNSFSAFFGIPLLEAIDDE